MNIKDNSITKKAEYLGLDLNNIPKNLKHFDSLDYRPSRNYDEKNYKTYRYLDVKDIKILLTPKNRLDPMMDKYAKAVPVYSYLNPQTEKDIEFHAKFLKMLAALRVDSIEELEEQQKTLNKKIPFRVKFYKDYLWQIHYSEYTNQYFMLVPTEDQDQSAFFYLLKRLLDKKAKDKIFVPICYNEYSTEYLRRSEIEELEKYIWFFTKEWPLIYDVYNKKENLTIYISGETFVYENIKSPYTIKLSDRESAIKFYKLLKALFILETELPKYYKFKIKINDEGGLDFYLNNKKLEYETSSEFIKNEYLEIEKQEKESSKEKNKLEKKLERIKVETGRLELEYLQKEREIAAFLECRRTFFGRVKYFLGKKKKSSSINSIDDIDKIVEDYIGANDNKSVDSEHYSNKKFYTLEELIERYKELDKEANYIKSIRIDIDAGEHKIKNMKLKIKNAILYLEEIDKHTKSIFEFWKFTNKDKIEQLMEGESTEQDKVKLKSTFDINLDLDVFSKELDKRQRNTLNREELNSIYIATTDLIKDVNQIAQGKEITEERLSKVKQEVLEEKMLLENENFDIFGNIVTDRTKINVLSNKKHRETKRDKIRLLDISKNTTVIDYEEYLKRVLINVQASLKKSNMQIEIPVYKLLEESELNLHLNIFNINPINLIGINSKKEEKVSNQSTIYRFNLNENTPAIGLTNIIYYDNNNQTLPLGMDISQEVLIDKSLLKIELKNNEEIKLVEYKEKSELSDVVIRTINIKEYDIK